MSRIRHPGAGGDRVRLALRRHQHSYQCGQPGPRYRGRTRALALGARGAGACCGRAGRPRRRTDRQPRSAGAPGSLELAGDGGEARRLARRDPGARRGSAAVRRIARRARSRARGNGTALMALGEVQTALARLLTDTAARAMFARDLLSAGRSLGLDEADARSVAALPPHALDRYGASLKSKRALDARKLLPLTALALGDDFAPRLREVLPARTGGAVADAIALGSD